MTFGDLTGTMVQRVVVRGPRVDGLAARQRAERLLAGMPAAVPGQGPTAILCVRRLTLRVPFESHSRPLEQPALHGKMEHLARLATRPILEPVPPQAQAVLFADEGELLACLALDVRHGLVQERWWWRSVLSKVSNRGGDFSQHQAGAVLVGQMLRRPQAAVAAIAWLENRDLAVEALLALTPRQAEEVLQAIVTAYQLTVAQFFPSLPAGSSASISAVDPPWQVAPIPPGFGPERAALLGLSVDLKVRFETVRTHEYQQRLSAWWQAAASGESAPLRSVDRPSGAAITPTPPNRREDAPLSEVLPADQLTVLRQKPMAAKGNNVGRERVERAGIQKAALVEIDYTQAAGSEAQPLYDAPRQQTQPGTTFPSVQSEPRAGRPPSATSVAEPDRKTPPEEGRLQDTCYILPPTVMTTMPPPQEQPEAADEQSLPLCQSTELGGVPYLINMMAVLDLPGCFEAGWQLASGVGAWGTLDALARELLGDELPRLREDPLWLALAHLDGRQPGLPPGFRLPRSRPRRWPDFELPPHWLKGLPDLELDPLSRSRLRRLRASYPPLLAGWLGRVLPFITTRLRLALRLTPQASLAHALLLVPGKFYLTSSNLDLIASIESISLGVRMAGLDSDPGWIPEFGRFIRFHFK